MFGGDRELVFFLDRAGFLWLLFGPCRCFGQDLKLNRPLRLSVLPDGAELFWSTEEVTMTERQSDEVPVCFPVMKVGGTVGFFFTVSKS